MCCIVIVCVCTVYVFSRLGGRGLLRAAARGPMNASLPRVQDTLNPPLARCQLLVPKTASTLWANILVKVKDSMSFESFMDLRNSSISTGDKLFPTDVLKQAIEKTSKVLHDEAICKAVTRDQPSSGSSSRKSSTKSSSSKADASFFRQGKGKKF